MFESSLILLALKYNIDSQTFKCVCRAIFLVDRLPPKRTDEIYEKLIRIYQERGYKDPVLSLNYEVEKLRNKGMSREKAILNLYRAERKKLLVREDTEMFAEKRLKELEKELKDLRMSELNRAEDIESIKKYLAYTHRLTTSQVIARICFYVIGAALIVLSFFQFNALNIYATAASGFEWIFILDCFVTFSLGVAVIALGWVLESMARVRPVF